MTAPGFTHDMGEHFRASAERLFGGLRGHPCAFLEVGVFEGQTADWLLQHFLDHADARYVGIESDAGRLDKAAATLARWGDKATLLLGDSAAVLPQLAAWTWRFEAAYVDGDHRHAQALADFAGCWPLLEPGGVLLADDCGHPTFPVRAALDGFLAGLPDGSWAWLQQGYQCAVRKVA